MRKLKSAMPAGLVVTEVRERMDLYDHISQAVGEMYT